MKKVFLWPFLGLIILVCLWGINVDTPPTSVSNPDKPKVDTFLASNFKQEKPWYSTAFGVDDERSYLSIKKRLLRMKPVDIISYGGPEGFEALEKGRLFIRKTKTKTILINAENIDWKAPGLGNYNATQLHAMVGLNSPLQGLERLSKQQERTMVRIVQQWMKYNFDEPGLHPRSWYEGTVVKRVSTLINLLNYVRRYGKIEGIDIDLILQAIALHGEYLLRENVYVTGNHGLRQDIALLAIAGAVPDLARRDEMVETALKRTNEAAKNLFSVEGVWKEHAPGYISYVVRLLKDLEPQIESSGLDKGKFLILKHIENSLSYLANIIAPDGRIPSVGRSKITHACGDDKVDMATEGKWPFPYRPLIGEAYPDYGHVVLRAGKGAPAEAYRDSFYLFANAAQNLPAGKRHADELSFLIYNLGRWWFIDSGHYTYENKPMRRYFEKPNAHSGYVIGNKHVRSQDRPELKSGILEADIEQTVAKVRMFSDRFLNGERVEREILVNRSNRMVEVNDKLIAPSSEKQRWTGFLQLADDLIVQRVENGVSAEDPESDNRLIICFDPKKIESYEILKGVKEPAQGWVIKDGQLMPSWSIIFKPRGHNMKMRLSWDDSISSCTEIMH